MKSVSKEDHPDFIGGVVWSRLELDWIRARDFKWESIVAEQRGTITALNIALGGEVSTSTENLVDAHDLDIGDVGLIALCRKLTDDAAPRPADGEIYRDMSRANASPEAVAQVDALVDRIANQAAPEQAYDEIDRHLRNSLADDDYAHYSQALDLIYTSTPPDAQAIIDKLTQEREFAIGERDGADVLLEVERESHEKTKAEVERLTTKLAAANERIAALEQDAARYQWLEENKFVYNGHCLALCGPILWEKTLSEAVDAAMKDARK